MKANNFSRSRNISLCFGLLVFLNAPRFLKGEPPPAAVAVFNAYSKEVEARMAQQHRSTVGFVTIAGPDSNNAEMRLAKGELIVDQIAPDAKGNLAGALLHHWRGTAFAPGATAADFVRLMRDISSFPQHFSPQVIQARMFTDSGDHMRAMMRVRQRHVIPVVLDMTYDIIFGQLDAQHGYSFSRSTRIAEISSAGTIAERALNAKEEHGFLWQMNIYWSYEERDGGLYMQMEAVSLTHSIPRGLGWAVGPYVNSIPRESLEFTLRSTCNALRK